MKRTYAILAVLSLAIGFVIGYVAVLNGWEGRL